MLTIMQRISSPVAIQLTYRLQIIDISLVVKQSNIVNRGRILCHVQNEISLGLH